MPPFHSVPIALYCINAEHSCKFIKLIRSDNLRLAHQCEKPGCRDVLVLDGNMKNARQVCACKGTSELKFPNGTIVVGECFIVH